MTAQKKPGLGNADLSLSWAERINECIEVVMGRRDRKVESTAVTAAAVSSTPSAADFNKLVDDMNNLSAKFNQLLDQVQD